MKVVRLSRALALLGCIALAACQTAPSQLASGPVSGVSSSSAVAPTSEYVLGTADKLKIIVFGENDLTGDFEVDSSGAVDFPLVGRVQAAGLTPQGFAAALTTALRSGYLRDPKVSVQVESYRPFFIMGEVTKPGEYPYRNGMNVVSAVATAGGFTYRAQTKSVFLKRAHEAQERKVTATPDVQIGPGDIVRVPERYF
ncbi:polysaccharide biosynthesis/export family protein [Terrihabitans sp. B22-R8]|uniref:polysaccharide biosynthesis/export family protein n=1 Tax=Terrihabitans sp. B22-R8 TaxID=3425128 RepID=UPI00403C8871